MGGERREQREEKETKEGGEEKTQGAHERGSSSQEIQKIETNH